MKQLDRPMRGEDMDKINLPIGVSARDYAASLRHAADHWTEPHHNTEPSVTEAQTIYRLRSKADEAQEQADREWADYSAWVSGDQT